MVLPRAARLAALGRGGDLSIPTAIGWLSSEKTELGQAQARRAWGKRATRPCEIADGWSCASR